MKNKFFGTYNFSPILVRLNIEEVYLIMQGNCWDKIEELFGQVLDIAPENRRQFIEQECGSDEELVREILSLVENHENSGNFLDDSVFSIGLRLLEDETDDLIRKKNFAHFKLIKLLGRGGMGTVYLAKDNKLKRLVALKVLPPQFSKNSESVARFRQEARAASRFSHPNIAHIYEFGSRGGRYYLAMEYVSGTTLREMISEKNIPLGEAVDITRQICQALLIAHQSGIIHRDIKPENIIVTEDKTVKILDFGLAKISETADAENESILDTSFLETSSGTIAGTTAYMSPEQVRGLKPDTRTDIWSLGVILYEMIAGCRPFDGETRSDIRAAILLKEFEMPPIVYSHLETILRKSLSKELDRRYATAAEMLDDLYALPDESDNDKTGKNLRTRRQPTESSADTIFSGILTLFRQPLLMAIVFGAILPLLLSAVIFFVNRQTQKNSAAADFSIKAQRITNRGKSVRSALSPDGNLLAYALEENGEQAIYIYNINSSETDRTKLLLPSANRKISGIAFAPDSENIHFAARSGDEPLNTLYKIPVSGETVEPEKILTDIENAPDMSPDGRQIAYLRLSNDDTHEEIRIADADGKNDRLLYERRMPEYISHLTQPVWSPDGRKILFAGAVYNENKQESYPFVIDIESGTARPVFSNSWEEIWHLDWLPDMRGFVFSGRQTKTNDNKQLWFVSYPNGEVKRLTEDYNDYYGVSISSTNNKTRLATIVLNRVAQLWKTAVADKTTPPVSLTSEGNYGLGLAESSDGKIFVGSSNSGNPDIWTMEKDGSDLRQLTFAQQLDQNPYVTSDNQFVIFSSERSGIKTLWRMKPDGSEQMPIVERATIENFTISPDGKTVCYYSYFDNQGALWRVGVDGANREKIIDGRFEAPAVSPDGRQIAAVHKKNEDSKSELAIWNLDDNSSMRFLKLIDGAQLPGTMRWAKDGKSIIYVVNRKGIGNLWQQSLSGDEPKQLTFFPSSRLFYFAFSPDEKEVTCARGQVEGYLILMSLDK